MNLGMRSLAKELTDALDRELSGQETAPAVGPAELFDLLVSVLADRVALELQSRQNGNDSSSLQGLMNVAKSIRDQVQSSKAEDTHGKSESSAPANNRFDVREKSPKYANIESLLRYDDTPDPRQGLKVVIMNFND